MATIQKIFRLDVEKDKDIIDKIEHIDDMTAYIKLLIRKDIGVKSKIDIVLDNQKELLSYSSKIYKAIDMICDRIYQ